MLFATVEVLSRGALSLARRCFWLQALAFAVAAVPGLLAPNELPPWMQSALLSFAAASATGAAAALAMTSSRYAPWKQRFSRGVALAGAAHVVGACIAATLALHASLDLPAFWSEAALLLAPVIGDDWARPGPFAGLGLLVACVLAAIPALVTIAAIATILLAAAVACLLARRRPALDRLLPETVACLVGLVSCAWIATNAMSGLLDHALVAMHASEDAEVLAIAGTVTRLAASLETLAAGLFAPVFLLAAIALFVWRRGGGDDGGFASPPTAGRP